MKFRTTHTGKYLVDGAVRIVTAPSMEKTKRRLAKGSLAADWLAVGDDLRRSMKKADARVG